MQQEDAMLARAQILPEIDAFIMRVTRLALGKLAGFLEPLDDMVFAEPAAERRVCEGAFIEAHQMLNLIGEHAADF
jgi:hypothetical protein